MIKIQAVPSPTGCQRCEDAATVLFDAESQYAESLCRWCAVEACPPMAGESVGDAIHRISDATERNAPDPPVADEAVDHAGRIREIVSRHVPAGRKLVEVHLRHDCTVQKWGCKDGQITDQRFYCHAEPHGDGYRDAVPLVMIPMVHDRNGHITAATDLSAMAYGLVALDTELEPALEPGFSLAECLSLGYMPEWQALSEYIATIPRLYVAHRYQQVRYHTEMEPPRGEMVALLQFLLTGERREVSDAVEFRFPAVDPPPSPDRIPDMSESWDADGPEDILAPLPATGGGQRTVCSGVSPDDMEMFTRIHWLVAGDLDPAGPVYYGPWLVATRPMVETERGIMQKTLPRDIGIVSDDVHFLAMPAAAEHHRVRSVGVWKRLAEHVDAVMLDEEEAAIDTRTGDLRYDECLICNLQIVKGRTYCDAHATPDQRRGYYASQPSYCAVCDDLVSDGVVICQTCLPDDKPPAKGASSAATGFWTPRQHHSIEVGFQFADGGRHEAGYQNANVSDCTVRAICNYCYGDGDAYKTVLRYLQTLQREDTRFDPKQTIRLDGVSAGIWDWYYFQMGLSRYALHSSSISDVVSVFSSGILETEIHLMALRDGTVLDTWDSRWVAKSDPGEEARIIAIWLPAKDLAGWPCRMCNRAKDQNGFCDCMPSELYTVPRSLTYDDWSPPNKAGLHESMDEAKERILAELQQLAAFCDGARTEDGAGFNRHDTNFGRSLATQNRLSDNQARAADGMLKKYWAQLGYDAKSERPVLDQSVRTNGNGADPQPPDAPTPQMDVVENAPPAPNEPLPPTVEEPLPSDLERLVDTADMRLTELSSLSSVDPVLLRQAEALQAALDAGERETAGELADEIARWECRHNIAFRPYQATGLDAIAEMLESHQRGVYQLPTGGGKTHIGIGVALDWLNRHSEARIVWLTHRKELEHQSTQRLLAAGISAENLLIISPIRLRNMIKRGDFSPAEEDLLVVDECHHSVAATWITTIESWPGRVLGLTATPWRMSKHQGLNRAFHELTCGPVAHELIDKWYLAPMDVYAPAQEEFFIEGKGRGTGGDYSLSETMEQSNAVLVEHGIQWLEEHWSKLERETRTIVYCIGVKHAHAVAQYAEVRGHKSAVLLGNTPKAERDGMLEKFAAGEFSILVNAEVATEGFDIPAVEIVLILRPTKSLALYLQMAGRATRPQEGKRAIILDAPGNCRVLGLPYDPRDWSLNPRGERTKGQMPTRECPSCQCENSIAARHCYKCGCPFGAECPECGHWERQQLIKSADGKMRCTRCHEEVQKFLFSLGTECVSANEFYDRNTPLAQLPVASPMMLRDGTWGIWVDGTDAEKKLKPGMYVQNKTRSGKTWRVQIVEILGRSRKRNRPGVVCRQQPAKRREKVYGTR